MDWFKNIVRERDDGRYELLDTAWSPDSPDDVRCFCAACGRPIPRFGGNEWVAEFLSRYAHGYHVSQLFTSQNRLSKLWADFQEAQDDPFKLQRFYNSVLGQSFTNKGFKITPGLLSSCVEAGYTMPVTATGCVAGVDIGKVAHVHISKMVDGKRRKVFVGHVPMDDSLSQVDLLLKVYGVNCCVIDAMPETTLVRAFQKRHRGKVLLCWFKRGISIKEAAVNTTDGEISVDRTQSLDSAFMSYKAEKVILPGNWRTLDEGDFLPQMCSNTRVQVKDEKTGEIHFEWKAPSGAKDHHQFADVYEHLAGDLMWGNRPQIYGIW